MTIFMTALVLEVGEDHLLVATPDRRFMRVPRAAGAVRVGEVIAIPLPSPAGAPVGTAPVAMPAPRVRRRAPKAVPGAQARPARPRAGRGTRLLALAAALALALAGSLAGVRAAPWWTAAAVVAVDINPSVEMAVDGDGRVSAARGLDPEGEDLVAAVPVRGLAVADAVKRLVAEAARAGFVAPERGGVVLLAVEERRAGGAPEPDALRDVALEALREAGAPGFVAANAVGREAAQAARKAGMSLNAWVIKEAAAAKGLAIADEALRRDPVGAAMAAVKAAGGRVPDFVPALVPVFGGDGEGDDGAGPGKPPGLPGPGKPEGVPGPPGGARPGAPDEESEGDAGDADRGKRPESSGPPIPVPGRDRLPPGAELPVVPEEPEGGGGD